MENINLIQLRTLRKDEKELKKTIQTVKQNAKDEALLIVPNGGTFELEGVGKYTLKVDKRYDLSGQTGKHARAWQKKKAQHDALDEQMAELKDRQSKLQEEMDRDGEHHVLATKGTDHAYAPQVSYTVVVL